MRLAPILDQYHDAFEAKYGSRLLPSHQHAMTMAFCMARPKSCSLWFS